ncbi:coiled-coil domain-containing protein 12-like [Hibiscus syriacus]|uniref:coiled-coil domain-containing protein 12-like n=1 Tax=Hibiscus syriacus TaxID=106335 RepID=UPI00192090BD|nr:coiled-coil domain-containing protein 12-like [Hibiscus syriacus]
MLVSFFDKVVQVSYKNVDHLVSVWAEWAELELRHKNFKGALELMKRATAKPSVEVKRRVVTEKVETHVAVVEESTEAPPASEEKEDPFVNIAPKKPNWDLRRNVQKKLDKLERRTPKQYSNLGRQWAVNEPVLEIL